MKYIKVNVLITTIFLVLGCTIQMIDMKKPIYKCSEIINNPNRFYDKVFGIKSILAICGDYMYFILSDWSASDVIVELHEDYKLTSKGKQIRIIEKIINKSQPRVKKNNPSIVIMPFTMVNIVALGKFEKIQKKDINEQEKNPSDFFVDQNSIFEYKFTIHRLDYIKKIPKRVWESK